MRTTFPEMVYEAAVMTSTEAEELQLRRCTAFLKAGDSKACTGQLGFASLMVGAGQWDSQSLSSGPMYFFIDLFGGHCDGE